MTVRQYSLKAPIPLWERLEAAKAKRPHMNMNALICDILDRELDRETTGDPVRLQLRGYAEGNEALVNEMLGGEK